MFKRISRKNAVIILMLVTFSLVASGFVRTEGTSASASSRTAPIEPGAGTWKTWVLTSGSQFRLPPPPDWKATKAELRELITLATQRDAPVLDRINYWDAGAPGYRWNEQAVAAASRHNINIIRASRALALLDVAIYDATIAAWDSKYTYKRLRPNQVAPLFPTVLTTPASPSYPDEHAVAAGAASQVLAYLFPADAAMFASMAEEAGRSRLVAGVAYPSDVAAGLQLGRTVADLVIARAQTDGSDIVWTGSVPEGPGYWIGTNPVEPLAGTWKPWVLTAGSQFRPGPPPAYGSEQLAAELAEVKTFARTPTTNRKAYFWQFPANSGFPQVEYGLSQLNQKLFEERLDRNAPRAARAYALQSIAAYDGFVACWDAKYTYWMIRPSQLDSTITTLFPNPGHPSYPSAHSCLSASVAQVMGYLFPRDAATFTTLANEAGESRLWAGIHFRSDITAGLELGRQTGQAVVERAQQDGAQ
jgi:membrane-associated phospholipid phosphatase